jgi:transglutaminase-like putative cysteine protease
VKSWLDNKGRTVLEKTLDGALITILEDEATVKKFLEKKTAGKDLILDFSLIKISKPLPHPEKLKFLKVQMSGIDSKLIPEDHRQKLVKADEESKDFKLTVGIEDIKELKKRSSDLMAQTNLDQYLAPSMTIQSSHPEIIDHANKILKGTNAPFDKISRLVKWTASNIRSKMQDSFTALTVLRSREGECQAHANLYTAMARSQNIPTRVITGLVYSEGNGFMYHAWAESYLDGWISIDPTLNQIPSDATHIKISAGDSSDEAPTLFKIMGKLKMEVIEFK